MNDSQSIVEILIKFGLLDAQNADTALQKLQLLDEQKRTGMLETLKAADATKELGQAEEAGAEHANVLHQNHRALHQILDLIGHVAGPAAGAAIAGIGSAAMGGGGVMLAVMAVRELYQAITETNKQVQELKDKTAEAMTSVAKDTTEAIAKIGDANEKVVEFWTKLNDKDAIAAVHAAFAAQLQQFHDIAAAAEKLGLIGKDQGKQFEEHGDVKAKEERAAELEASVATLKASLGKISGDSEEAIRHRLALRQEEKELGAKKGELETAKVVSESGSGQAKEDAKYSIPGLQSSVDAMQAAYDKNLKSDADRTAKLQETITRMTDEIRQLHDSVSKTKNEQGTTDFAQGVTIANTALAGGKVSAAQQIFLRAVEEQITGKDMTFEQAAVLIKAQAANTKTQLLLLENHAADIASIQQRLDGLLGGQNILSSKPKPKAGDDKDLSNFPMPLHPDSIRPLDLSKLESAQSNYHAASYTAHKYSQREIQKLADQLQHQHEELKRLSAENQHAAEHQGT